MIVWQPIRLYNKNACLLTLNTNRVRENDYRSKNENGYVHGRNVWVRIDLLADEKNINGAQVEFIEERQCGKPVFASVHAGIELENHYALANGSVDLG